MKTLRSVIGLGLLVMGSFAFLLAEAGERHRVKSVYRCGIPFRSYHNVEPVPATAYALSGTGYLLRRAGADAASAEPSGIQVFQLQQARLGVNHCEISQVVFTLDKKGNWKLGLHAEQNPRDANGEPILVSNRPGQILQTFHLLRNEFYITLRALGGSSDGAGDLDSVGGRPVLFEVPIDPFWVQNGQPADKLFHGHVKSFGKYQPFVDRVEVVFTYR